MLTNIFWWPLAAATAHIIEEFGWPGGFTAWYRKYRPEIASSISRPFLFWINAALLFGCFSVGVDGPTRFGPPFFVVMIALLATNGLFHLRAVVRTRSYSPGVVTGTLLYIPLGIYGFAAMLPRMSVASAITSAAIGASYPFVSYFNHRRRVAAQVSAS